MYVTEGRPSSNVSHAKNSSVWHHLSDVLVGRDEILRILDGNEGGGVQLGNIVIMYVFLHY